MQAVGDRSELPLGFGVDVRALMKGMEELVPLVGMGAEQSSQALVQLELSGFNGSSHTPWLCDQGSNFIVHVMVLLKLSCNSPVFLGSGVVIHGCVH